MRSKNKILPLLMLAAALQLFTGCGALRRAGDIQVTSCGVESVSPVGLRSLKAVLSLGIDNPSIAFTIENLEGTVRYYGRDIAYYSAQELSVDKKCVKVYDLPCAAALSGDVSIMQLLSLVGNGSMDGFTTDITAKVKLKSGVGKTLKFKDIQLKDLMSSGKQETYDI